MTVDNASLARGITRVIWRVRPDDLEAVLDSMGEDEVMRTVSEFNSGVDFFETPAGKRFYKNGKVRKGTPR